MVWPGTAGEARQGSVRQGSVGCGYVYTIHIKRKVLFMVYEWKSGTRVNANAQVAGEMCARLEKDGRLTAKDLLDENRPSDAPLHECFEWNDTKAAEKFRETQARHIINSLVIKVENREPVRAYFKVETQERQYRSIEAIIKTEDSYGKLLASAISELGYFRKKYESIVELADVFKAIDAVIEIA